MLLSLVACIPALLRVWQRPTARGFAWGIVHCSLSAFLLGFHVHEKAILVPTIVLAALSLDSYKSARLYLRMSYVGGFALFPLLPGPELIGLKVLLLATHLLLAQCVLQCTLDTQEPTQQTALIHPSLCLPVGAMSVACSESTRVTTSHRGEEKCLSEKCPPSEDQSNVISSGADNVSKTLPSLLTHWDMCFICIGIFTFLAGEVVYPFVLGGDGEGPLPFLPLMMVSVQCALGVVWCWCVTCQLMWVEE
ncbi:unnamed protein product [Choristocarpus tenellus]